MDIFTKKAVVSQDESHWLSVSDLMAGLMMVFLFIAIALMREAIIERDKIKEIAVAYQENQVAIYQALVDEFSSDLEIWDAAIDKDSLTFIFRSPDVLFKAGSTELSTAYMTLLANFFPRYMTVLAPFHDSINEVVIEGHTSSIWGDLQVNPAYFRNMELSQGRTRSVLYFVYYLDQVEKYQKWIKSNVAAVGLSSSRLIYENGREDTQKSRRVNFRVITNADIQIKKILSDAAE